MPIKGATLRTSLSSRTTAALAAALMILVAGGGVAEAAAAQVTKAEYGKVKLGMTPTRVRNIVEAKGELFSGEAGSTCMVRHYSGWNGRDVYFKFEDNEDAGKLRLTDKAAFGPLGGIPPLCPSVS